MPKRHGAADERVGDERRGLELRARGRRAERTRVLCNHRGARHFARRAPGRQEREADERHADERTQPLPEIGLAPSGPRIAANAAVSVARIDRLEQDDDRDVRARARRARPRRFRAPALWIRYAMNAMPPASSTHRVPFLIASLRWRHRRGGGFYPKPSRSHRFRTPRRSPRGGARRARTPRRSGRRSPRSAR